MKILIDIGHPAHVHLFKHYARLMMAKGHEIFFTCREREFIKELLDHEGFQYKCFGRYYRSMAGKLSGLIANIFREIIVVRKFHPDILISHGSVCAAVSAIITGRPHIALEDTGNNEQVNLYKPFTKIILSPKSFHKNYGAKHYRYNAVHEWAYLDPKYFSPDHTIREQLGIKDEEKLVLLRFVSWKATHDRNLKGFTVKQKSSLIKMLKGKARILVSCEGEMPNEFSEFALKIPPFKIHDLLATTDLYIGEGASMASECALLGTPAIYVNPQQAGTIDDQEKTGLLFHLQNGDDVMELIETILATPKTDFVNKKEHYTFSMTDINKGLCWLTEKWPESLKEIKQNSEIINSFH